MAGKRKRVSAAQQDYLEAILLLEREKGAARVRDIAAALSVHKSTVTSALRTLGSRGLVNYRPYELVTLSAAGRRVAEEVSEHHTIISRFLSDVLRLDRETAETQACRLEHVMDAGILQRLVLFARFARESARADEQWLRRFDKLVAADKGHGNGN